MTPVAPERALRSLELVIPLGNLSQYRALGSTITHPHQLSRIQFPERSGSVTCIKASFLSHLPLQITLRKGRLVGNLGLQQLVNSLLLISNSDGLRPYCSGVVQYAKRARYGSEAFFSKPFIVCTALSASPLHCG